MAHLLFVLLVASGAVYADTSRIQFEPNRGQTAAEARYLARTGQSVLFFTDRGIVMRPPNSARPVMFEFRGARPGATWEALQPTGDTTSYHVGRDSRRWADGVPAYARLKRHELWQGIDAVFYGAGDRMEYDFVIAPGADAATIRLLVTGASKISIDREGSLIVKTADGEFRQSKPRVFQTASNGGEVLRSGQFQLISRNEVGFRVGDYDRSLPLTIDPVIDSSTYLGGRGDDRALVAANGVIFGTTTSIDFPGVLGRRSGVDAYFRSGNFTTIVGGSGDDVPTGAYASSEGIVLAGYTTSKDLPTPLYFNPLQPEFAGGETDGFLYVSTRQGPLVTYFGTSGADRITGLAGLGTSIYFTGFTTGRFPFINASTYGPGGQEDGFFGSASISNGLPVYALNLRYFGGTGNDRPYAISAGTGYYVVGETDSNDFPAPGQRNGPTDAFVLRYSGASINPTGVLYGGNGTDRATAVSATYSIVGSAEVAAAGVTTSTDLALVKPAQSNYGGGASDAFWLAFDLNFTPTQSSYWGGTEADEATSVLLEGTRHTYVGGWTRSPDFPTTNAVQSNYGGGEDGFLVHVDDNQQIHQSTYFGGSGNDRVLSINSAGNYSVRIAGETTSANLPVKLPQQASLAGGSDGFVAQISAAFIGGGKRVLGSANYRSQGYLTLPLNVTEEITVAVADASIALVGATVDGTMAESAVLAANANSYAVECLSNSGSTDLTVASPGLPSFVVHLDCVPPSIVVSIGNNFATRLWAQPTNVYVSLAAYSEDLSLGTALTPKDLSGVADGTVTVSNPDVATVSSQKFRAGEPNNYNPPFTITPKAVGQTDISVSAPGFLANKNSTIHLSVASPLASTAPQPVAAGFQVAYSPLSGALIPQGTTVTVTSADPARLAVAVSAIQFGSGSVTYNANSGYQVYLQALDSSGEVPVTISASGLDPITYPVRLTRPVLNVSAATSPTKLVTGQSAAFSAYFTSEAPGFSMTPNPWVSSPRLAVTSSDPAVASISGASAPTIAPGQFSVSIGFQAAAPGTAQLSVTSTNVPDLASLPGPIAVVVTTPPAPQLRFKDVELGNNLSLGIPLNLPLVVTQPVVITSSDPSRVLVATGGTAGVNQLVIQPANLSNGFSLYGLSDTGSATITVAAPDLPPATFTVTLAPSGLGWNTTSITTDLRWGPSGSISQPSILAYVLDRATSLPLAAQGLRPGITATVQVQSDNTGVAALNVSSFTLGSQNSCPFCLKVQINGPGEATVSFTQPAGFTTPVGLQKLLVRVDRVPVAVGLPSILGIYTQMGISASTSIPLAFQRPITLTSSDPSKIVFSTTPNSFGGPVITFKPDETVYIQAGSDRGTVTIRASSENFLDYAYTIQLGASSIGMSVGNSSFSGGPVLKNGKYYFTPRSSNLQIGLFLTVVHPDTGNYLTSINGAQLTPNIDPAIEIRSSNPQVGNVLRSPVRFLPNSGDSTIEFRPVGLGETEVAPVLPPGFRLPVDQATSAILRAVVETPTFESKDLVVGRDLVTNTFINFLQNVGAVDTNTTVTLTSADTSRVLLSTSATAPGTASITRTIAAFSANVGDVFVHGLASEGVVPVTISAPGFADGTLRVYLVPSQVGFENYLSTIMPSVNTGTLRVRVSVSTVPPSGVGYGTMAARPGAPPIDLSVTSSNPSVLAVDTPALRIEPGVSVVEVMTRTLAPGSVRLTLGGGSQSVPVSPAQSEQPITVTQ